jgi:hypothetical protein
MDKFFGTMTNSKMQSLISMQYDALSNNGDDVVFEDPFHWGGGSHFAKLTSK